MDSDFADEAPPAPLGRRGQGRGFVHTRSGAFSSIFRGGRCFVVALRHTSRKAYHARFHALLLSLLAVSTGFAQESDPPAKGGVPPARPRKADGAVRLPNSWSIKPAGKQIELGDFPINVALHSSAMGSVLMWGPAITKSSSSASRRRRNARRSRVVIDQSFAGLTFSPDGKSLFVGGGESDVVYHFPFEDGYLANRPS